MRSKFAIARRCCTTTPGARTRHPSALQSRPGPVVPPAGGGGRWPYHPPWTPAGKGSKGWVQRATEAALPNSEPRGGKREASERQAGHDVVTAVGSLVPITSMKASSLSLPNAPRSALIDVETAVGPARARARPPMRAVPYSDLCVSSRRSRGYEKPKRAFITGPLGSTQHRELRPAHRKRPSHRETKRASNGM